MSLFSCRCITWVWALHIDTWPDDCCCFTLSVFVRFRSPNLTHHFHLPYRPSTLRFTRRYRVFCLWRPVRDDCRQVGCRHRRWDAWKQQACMMVMMVMMVGFPTHVNRDPKRQQCFRCGVYSSSTVLTEERCGIALLHKSDNRSEFMGWPRTSFSFSANGCVVCMHICRPFRRGRRHRNDLPLSWLTPYAV